MAFFTCVCIKLEVESSEAWSLDFYSGCWVGLYCLAFGFSCIWPQFLVVQGLFGFWCDSTLIVILIPDPRMWMLLYQTPLVDSIKEVIMAFVVMCHKNGS